MDAEGIKICVNPVPGLAKEIVVPIPTPVATDSKGLK